jgi:hypothetical protein
MEWANELLGTNGIEGHGLFFIMLFGGLLFAVTSRGISQYHPPLKTRYLLNFMAFYLLGPMSWGLVWWAESGNTNRFVYLFYTFWGFALFFGAFSIMGWAISKWMSGRE